MNFDGKKTYAICALALVWAVVGALAGWIEWDQAIPILEVALVGAGLRHGFKTGA